jgi:hypothetical protein
MFCFCALHRWKMSQFLRHFLLWFLWIVLLESAQESAQARPNPLTSSKRVLVEFNAVPNTQWAPNSIDPDAKPNRSLQIFKLQPVFPFRLNNEWTVLTQTIFRFTSTPSARPDFGVSPFGAPFLAGWDQRNDRGLSDISPTAIFVPNLGSDWTIGLGPSMVIPVGDGPTDNGKLSIGPALFGFHHSGPWTIGARVRNIWSVAGDPQRADVNLLIVRPLIRYQFHKNWYVTTSPIISADWTHPDGDGWTVPVGGGLGHVFSVADHPMQVSVEGYYNAIKPSFAGEDLLGDWTIRTQLQVIFPR